MINPEAGYKGTNVGETDDDLSSVDGETKDEEAEDGETKDEEAEDGLSNDWEAGDNRAGASLTYVLKTGTPLRK